MTTRTCASVLGLILIACGSDTDIFLYPPETSPKLVLSFVERPDRTWSGYVTLSKSLLESPDIEAVENATITIYEDGHPLQVLHHAVDSKPFVDAALYVSDNLSPIIGKTYSIEASIPSFAVVESSYRQPALVTVDDFRMSRLGANPEVGESAFTVIYTIKFLDPPGPNYYEFLVTQTSQSDLDSPSIIPEGTVGPISFADATYNGCDVYDRSIAFDDLRFEGQAVELSFSSVVAQSPGSSENMFVAFLRNTSQSYYEYTCSSSLQTAVRNDPYAQPVPIKTNIFGGLGLFGGYTQSSKVIKFP